MKRSTPLFFALTSTAVLIACGSSPDHPDQPRDSGANRDSGVLRDAGDDRDAGEERDAGPARDGGPVRDAGPRDGGPARDGGPDNSLDGTSLSGVVVEWAAPLALCSQWREGTSLAEERAAKVMVELPAQTRALGQLRMSEATLVGGTVRRSPMAADRLPINNGVTSTLDTWDLRNPAGDSSLTVKITHVLADGSSLEENFSVTRQRGDQRPVVIDGNGFSHYFVHTASTAAMAVVLERCGGSDVLAPSVDAMVGTSGAESVVVYRYLNTRAAVAGSAPVVPTAASVVLSDRPWEVFRAIGFWSQTYSAQHHNWQEYSVIDYTRDLAWFETAYEPFLNGGRASYPMMIREVRINEAAGLGGSPSIDVDLLDLTNGGTTTRTFATDGAWRAVDTDRAAWRLAPRCANPNVTTVQSSAERYAFHLLSCPGSTGTSFALDMLVLGAFEVDPAQVGEAFEGTAIQTIVRDGRSGYAIAIGAASVEITKNPGDQYYFLNVLDGGQSVENSLAFELAIREPEIGDETLRFRTTDGAVTGALTRRYAGQGAGSSSIFAPVSLELTYDGQTLKADSWDALDYTNTHHNWLDALDATVDGVRLHWSVDFGSTEINRVSAVRASDGAVLLPPTEVNRVP